MAVPRHRALRPPSGGTVQLNARADGARGAVMWSSVPAGVVFGPTSAGVASATFPAAGAYVITATIADGSAGVLALTSAAGGPGGESATPPTGRGQTSPPPAAGGGGGGGGGGGSSAGALGLLLGLPLLRLRRRRS